MKRGAPPGDGLLPAESGAWRTLVTAVMLNVVGGWIGTLGLLGLARNLPFMSGNTVELGAGIVHRDWHMAASVASLLAAFIVGSLGAELIGAALRRRGVLLLSALAVLLGGAALLQWRTGDTALFAIILAFGMGIETAVMHQAGGARISLTYVTGTIVSANRSLVAALWGRGRVADAVAYVALWSGFLAGAMIGEAAMRISLAASASFAASLCVPIAVFGTFDDV